MPSDGRDGAQGYMKPELREQILTILAEIPPGRVTSATVPW
jgi:hypothetical protein